VKTCALVLDQVQGKDAAFLWCHGDIEGLPDKYIILPADADAGHLAAAAQYLALTSSATVYVHESVMDYLDQSSLQPSFDEPWPFVDDAARRGVRIERLTGGIRMLSDNGQAAVIVIFPAWDTTYAGTAEPRELLELAGV